ncbi:helix-turn-helix transcriptional regulator [Actinomadura alba]|uniref:Helix-turn-helix transcriptional regulator n=1 Tax=Actinomadura alba TaxID=406431 RepID=A0ABR7LHH5_9ACTN|nr:helix-turn-helix transcriptional regulator [Actinomadura alba]MBC6464302.1 helix-turn-helix transcriptional regulator [Actinomadura alba]
MQSVKVDGHRLRAVREERELTTTQLAALVSVELGRPVSQSTITKYEMGHRQPRPQMFGALCRALRRPKTDLLVQTEGQSV